VRLLWYVLPSYKEVYARVEQIYGITAGVASLKELVCILAWVLGDVVAQSGLVLASVALAAHSTLSTMKGEGSHTLYDTQGISAVVDMLAQQRLPGCSTNNMLKLY
jgi:hypothetical protein